MLSIDTVRNNLQRARELIHQSGGSTEGTVGRVKIMAVTKTHPPEVVRMAIKAGITVIGENRVSEGGRKIKDVGRESAEFHMIGPVHTGEVRQAVRDFHWLDSIDRMKIIREVARRTVSRGDPHPGLLLEVNTSGEESKHGFPPDIIFLEEIIGRTVELGLDVAGMMTVGPLGAGERETRKAFALLRDLRDGLRRRCTQKLDELSMGMSDDFQLAVMEGSTTVRLGRFLFGSRKA